MVFKIVVKDYRILKSAVCTFEPGINLISATNSSGKSTLVKAVKTLLDGDFGNEANPRHGCNGYSIAMKCDESKITFRRVGKDSYIRGADGVERCKLGKGALNKLAPEFPLRRVDYLDSSFYPSIVSQGRLPIFEDISVFDLFSSMFGDISKISGRQDSLKKEITRSKKELADTEALLKHYQAEELRAGQAVRDFSQGHLNLEQDLKILEQAKAIQREISSIQNDKYLKYPNGVSSEVEQQVKLCDLPETQYAFEALVRVKSVQSLVDQIEETKEKLSNLEYPPEVNYELLEDAISLEDAKSQLEIVQQQFSSIEQQIKEIETQLKAVKCPSILEGICPYQQQIIGILQTN